MKFETKIKIEDSFIKHRSYFARGQSFIYDFKTAFQAIFYPTAILITYFGFKPPLWVYIPIAIIYVLIFWYVGYRLDGIGYFHRETEFNNLRNPLAKQLRKKFDIKEDLKNDNKIELS